MIKGFRRACLSRKFVSLYLLDFNEIEDYWKVCFITFRVNGHILLFSVLLHCLVMS